MRLAESAIRLDFAASVNATRGTLERPTTIQRELPKSLSHQEQSQYDERVTLPSGHVCAAVLAGRFQRRTCCR